MSSEKGVLGVCRRSEKVQSRVYSHPQVVSHKIIFYVHKPTDTSQLAMAQWIKEGYVQTTNCLEVTVGRREESGEWREERREAHSYTHTHIHTYTCAHTMYALSMYTFT